MRTSLRSQCLSMNLLVFWVVLETEHVSQSQAFAPSLFILMRRSCETPVRMPSPRDTAASNNKQEASNMADLGKKYCVNCLADVTNLRLRCTDCPDIELCPECFSAGAEIGNHRRWHGYQQVDGGRFPLWGPEAEGGWTSREEQSLLDAIEQYGFGNWVFHFIA